MKKLIAIIVSLFITSVTGFSQDFLNRYPQLDENNIDIFFKDWKCSSFVLRQCNFY